MKPKTMILMVVAVVCGLAASYMTSRLLADKAPPPPVNTVTVLVAKQKISAWAPIKNPEELFVEKDVPEGTFSPKCITDFKDLKNQALKAPINEDMPVTKDDLLSEQTAGLVAMLPKGERAVAIRVTPESLAGGFVLPGSKVDIVFTMKRGDGDSKAQIIMQDMMVLAVDMKNTRDDGENSMLGNTVTLAAKPEDSERLSLAAQLGDLRLLLRSPLDTEKPNYKAVSMTDIPHQGRDGEDGKTDSTDVASAGNITAGLPSLPKVDKTPAPVKEPEKAPEPVTHTLRIESGDTVSKTVFVWNDKDACWEGGTPTKKSDAKKVADAPKTGDEAKPEDAPKPKKAEDAPKPRKAPAAPATDPASPVG